MNRDRYIANLIFISLYFLFNFRRSTTSVPFRRPEIAPRPSANPRDELKGSFYDPKNDLIVTYKTQPDGGVSVFYTAPKANNKDFIDR